jgi:hypothetical protein
MEKLKFNIQRPPNQVKRCSSAKNNFYREVSLDFSPTGITTWWESINLS